MPPDSEFLNKIKQNIAQELDEEKVLLFRNALKQELDDSLKKHLLPPITDNQTSLIVDGLIQMLQLDKTGVPVITSVLTNAAMCCLDKRGNNYQATLAKHEEIKEAIKQILGWLVLAAVDPGFIQGLNSASHYSKLYFELPVKTPAGVEIIISRHVQRLAKLKTEGIAKGTDILLARDDQFSWKSSETAEQLKQMLWNQVFPDRTKSTHLNQNETSQLNAELEIRFADEWFKEHHIIAIESANIIAKQDHQTIYQQLLADLPNLTLVQFGIVDNTLVFYAPEQNLMSAINRFLQHINKA